MGVCRFDVRHLKGFACFPGLDVLYLIYLNSATVQYFNQFIQFKLS